MTREDLVDWLKSVNCQQVPLSGMNVSGAAIKFLNPKTGRHTYIDCPIDQTDITEYAIAHICTELGINTPDCAVDLVPRVKALKERFSPLVQKNTSSK